MWASCLNGLQGFVCATCREEPPGDLSGNFRNLSDLWFVLGDVCVNVALSVGNLLQRQPDGAHPGAFGHIVGVDWTYRRPTDDLPVLVCGLAGRLSRQHNHTLLQVLQPCRSKYRL